MGALGYGELPRVWCVPCSGVLYETRRIICVLPERGGGEVCRERDKKRVHLARGRETEATAATAERAGRSLSV